MTEESDHVGFFQIQCPANTHPGFLNLFQQKMQVNYTIVVAEPCCPLCFDSRAVTAKSYNVGQKDLLVAIPYLFQ